MGPSKTARIHWRWHCTFAKLLVRTVKLLEASASPEELEANMKAENGNCRMTSLVGTLAVLALGYVFVKNLPDILRYIKISRM